MTVDHLCLAVFLLIAGLQWLAVCMEYALAWRAFPRLQRHARRLKSLRQLSYTDKTLLPPLTLLIPLGAEREGATPALRQLMQLEYPKLDYLVIHNSGDQATFENLRENFGLRPVPRFPVSELWSRTVKGVYQSEDVPNLWVIDKEPGRFADALNAGLNFCQTPLVSAVELSTQIEHNALLQLSRPFLENAKVWAVSGRIRPQASPEQPLALPESRWGQLTILLQQRKHLVFEFMRSVRQAFGQLSPELSMFRRSVLVEAGGFTTTEHTFMIETAIRLRRLARLQGAAMMLMFLPDTLGWKKPPEQAEDFRQMLSLEQMHLRIQLKSEKALRRKATLLWHGLGQPLWVLLMWFSILPALVLGPLWLVPWFLAVMSPAAVGSMALQLGELTSHRFQRQDLLKLHALAWRFPLFYHQRIALWLLQGWLKPLPQPETPKYTATSPLKGTARLGELNF